jgi:Protein of unknown function (DUF5672)
MESIHIFDEFPEPMSEISGERKHLKRLRLETLVFDILKRKYSSILCDFWETYKVPKNSDKCVVLIERRIHENLFFLLRNAGYFARGWSICIVCSDMNLQFCKEISGHNKENIQFLPIFKGNPEPAIGKKEYNGLLQTADFYKQLDAECLLCMETDTYLRRQIPEDLLEYDYAACPYEWDETFSGGGITFRKRSAMIRICESIAEKNTNQDVYICDGIRKLGYKMPEFMKGITYFAESCFYEDPVGVHQWWTFFTKDVEDAELIFESLCCFVLEGSA